MSSETTSGAAAEAAAAKNSVKDAAKSALETGQRGLNEALERAERSLNEAARRAEKALREGVETLPTARLAGVELEIRLLALHRERLVDTRTRLINELRWQLHDLWPEWEIPKRVLVGRPRSLDAWHEPRPPSRCRSRAA